MRNVALKIVGRSQTKTEIQSFDDHVRAWKEEEGRSDGSRWKMAEIAASVTVKFGSSTYGQGDVEKFAAEVKRAPGHIRRMARVHVLVENGHPCPNSNLSFTHYLRAITHTNPVEALEAAISEEMSVEDLEQWIADRKPRPRPRRQKSKKARDDFHVYLEHVDEVITDDFIPSCPDPAWAKRLFRSVLEEIRDENRQRYIDEAESKVIAAVKGGALTIADIKQATRLLIRDIEAATDNLVKSGGWVWSETGEGHGSRRPKILKPTGQPPALAGGSVVNEDDPEEHY